MRLLLVLVLALASACQGNIYEPGSNGPNGADGSDGAVGALQLRMLTRNEYDNTVRDLFGYTGAPARDFPSEITGDSGFATVGRVSDLHVRELMEASEEVAAYVVAELPALLPCDPATGETECAREMFAKLGPQVYRRPLRDGDLEELVSLYESARGELGRDFDGAIELVVRAMLQSPFFLYHWEHDALDATELDPWFLASRLSYFLWRSMPDEALFAAAESGSLRDPAELQAQARRMLDDPRARQVVDDFFRQLLRVDKVLTQPKSPSLYPELDDAMRRAMLAEVSTFIEQAVFEEEGTLTAMLTASHGYAQRLLGRGVWPGFRRGGRSSLASSSTRASAPAS